METISGFGNFEVPCANEAEGWRSTGGIKLGLSRNGKATTRGRVSLEYDATGNGSSGKLLTYEDRK